MGWGGGGGVSKSCAKVCCAEVTGSGHQLTLYFFLRAMISGSAAVSPSML